MATLSSSWKRTGKNRTELTYRMQFAERFPSDAELSSALESFASRFVERYPTEDELCTTVHSFDSWTAIRKSLAKKRAELKFRAQFAEQYPTEDELANALASFHVLVRHHAADTV